MEPASPDQTLELSINDLASGGAGLGRDLDGRVVFVPGALAGERVRARIARSRKDYLEARLEEVLTASPARVEPACPLYGRCGGCDLMHLAYGEQVKAKGAWVSRALSRLPGGLRPEVKASPLAWGYRNRVRWQVRGGRLGFFARASHELVEVDQCPVAAPEINGLLPALKGLMNQPEAPAEAWVEVVAGEGRALFTLGLAARVEPSFLEQAQNLAGSSGMRISLKGRLGQYSLTPASGLAYYQRGELTLRAFPGLFCQVNFAANRLLIEAVLKAAGPGKGRSALDLYAGLGNFSLPLAQAGWQVLAVEGEPKAARAARFQAMANGLEERVEVAPTEAEEALLGLRGQGQGFGLVVLDPPRGGAKGLMPAVLDLGPRQVVYVSCHPATLARDARVLAEGGYAPRSLTVVDMFPHTGHVEAVLALERESG